MLASGQNTGLPRRSRARVCRLHAHPGNGLLQIPTPSPDLTRLSQREEGLLLRLSGGPEAQTLLATCAWCLGPGWEAWASSVSLPTIPGLLPA